MKISRGVLHDLYVDDFRAAVMVGDEVLVLSELATSIVLSVPETGETNLEFITTTLIQQYGKPEPPDDAGTIVLEQVHDLAAHAILILDQGPRATPSVMRSGDTREIAATLAVQSAMTAVLVASQAAPWVLPEDVTSTAFLAAVRRQRVGAQLVSRLDRLDLPLDARAMLLAHGEELRLACIPLARDLTRMVDALESIGIRCLVFKGLPLAAQAWGDALARGYGDLDVLVHPDDLVTAFDALRDAGWEPTAGHPVPGDSWSWRQFLRTDNEVPLMRERTMVDLHWHVSPNRSSFPSFNDLWSRRADVVIEGKSINTFSLYDALAHSAGHSTRDGWRWLRGLADVHRLMALPETWLAADRPLRHDQLLSVGISARVFGPPDCAPLVVHESAQLTIGVQVEALDNQLRSEHATTTDRLPGAELALKLRAMWRTRTGLTDYARHLTWTLLPPWVLVDETSTHAWVAAPRVLGRRLDEVFKRLTHRGAS